MPLSMLGLQEDGGREQVQEPIENDKEKENDLEQEQGETRTRMRRKTILTWVDSRDTSR